jgi:hypothetical protein
LGLKCVARSLPDDWLDGVTACSGSPSWGGVPRSPSSPPGPRCAVFGWRAECLDVLLCRAYGAQYAVQFVAINLDKPGADTVGGEDS